MEATLLILVLLVFFTFVGLGVYVTAKAVGAAKRGVDRGIEQARRTVEDTTLRARSLGQAGTGAALAQLRLDLRTSMRATQAALHEGVREDPSLKESLALFEQLSAHGRELDAELKRLEQEPDKSKVIERLPDLRARTQRIVRSADSLRWAAHDRARRFADDDLAHLTAQIEVESDALRDWSPSTAAPDFMDDALAASTGAASAGPADESLRAPAGRADEGPGTQAPPAAPAASDAGAARSPKALHAPDPAATAAPPWHATKRRPETA
ncbi:hypothetical protein [Streptomyces sp. NRRL S-87]|uniref:hypothetical protein n=1 Tax=Streptomyces sp. NRRL S-87 TaxID=1463920 RepID=UPI0004C1A337|nr:hypothetical protein [Streptomyces sp. NRRL S-87]